MTSSTALKSITVAPISATVASEYEKTALGMAQSVTSLKIVNQGDYEAAAGLLSAVKAMSKQADEARKKITAPLDQAKKAVMELFLPVMTRLDNAERHIKGLILTYTQDQARIRREEEAHLAKEAAKKQAAIEERAKKAEANGKTEKAEELRQKAAEVQAPVLASPVQKVAGLSMRKQWKARIKDYSLIPREMLYADDKQKDVHQSYFNKMAEGTKGSLPIAGIEWVVEEVVASS